MIYIYQKYHCNCLLLFRKGYFDVKKCSAICEDHFTEDRIVSKKKGRSYLVRGSVPTVYYRETKEGLEKIEVEFDYDSCQYIGQESVNLLRGNVSTHEEKVLLQDRRQKVMELKNLCRFCFESQDDKFVAVKKLESYSIEPDDMLSLIGIGPQYNEVFSEIVCEQCFQQIVTIDGYRKRCQKAQEEVISEMQELDIKLQSVINLKTEESPWYKFEAIDADIIIDQNQPTHIEIVEEHLEEDDNISYVGEDDDFETEQFVFDDFKEDKAIMEDFKEEPMDESDLCIDHTYESNFENDEDDDEDTYQTCEASNKDVYNITDTDAIIKNPDRNSFALRVYECFFCRLVRFPKLFPQSSSTEYFPFRNSLERKRSKLMNVR